MLKQAKKNIYFMSMHRFALKDKNKYKKKKKNKYEMDK